MRQLPLPAICFAFLAGAAICGGGAGIATATAEQAGGLERKFLYVAAPGIRDYLEYGGHGILVFEINAGHKFVKCLASGGREKKGRPLNVKGICTTDKTQRLYGSSRRTLMCFDLIRKSTCLISFHHI